MCELLEKPFWYRTARDLPRLSQLKARLVPRPDAKVVGLIPEGHAVRCVAGGGDWLMCSIGKIDNCWILVRTQKREIFTLLDATGAVTTWRDEGDEERAALRKADAEILEKCIESNISPFNFTQCDPMRKAVTGSDEQQLAAVAAQSKPAAEAKAAGDTEAEGDAADEPAEAPADAPVEAPADAPTDAPADVALDATADAAADAPADAPAKKSRFGFGKKKS